MAERGVNKAILVGRLGGDPEVRYSQSGNAIANINLATTDSWKDRESGERQERTEWHRVVFFSRLAEIVAEYLRKGSQVYVEGRIQTRKWQDKEGRDRYTTEIVANEMHMLGGRAASGDDARVPPADAPERQPGQSAQAGQSGQSGQSGGGGKKPADIGDDFDDDIPF